MSIGLIKNSRFWTCLTKKFTISDWLKEKVKTQWFSTKISFFQGDEDIKDDLLDDASQSDGEVNSQSEGDEQNDGAGDSSAPNSPSLKKRRARRADWLF